MRISKTAFVWLALAVSAAAGLTGLPTEASAEQPADPDTLLERLENQPDARKTHPTVVGTLVGIWRNGAEDNRRRALEILVRHPHPIAASVYVSELRSDEFGFADAAASALGELKVRRAIPQMLEVYENTSDDDLRAALFSSFAQMPDERLVEASVKILDRSVDEPPINLHANACKILGELAQRDPDLLDGRARTRLVRGLYLANQKGQTTERPCGLGVQQLGQPAVPMLLEVLAGENEAVDELMTRYNGDVPRQFPPNRPKSRAAQRLTSLRADDAVDVFLRRLRRVRETPSDLDPRRRRAWATWEAQAIDAMLRGLGDLGAAKSEDVLVSVLRGEFNERWEAILGPMVELQLRQNAGRALVRLGVRSARQDLLEMARDGVIERLEERAAAMAESDRIEPMEPVERYQFNWMNARSYAYLAGSDDRDAFESMVDSRDSEAVRQKMRSYLAAFDVADACLSDGSADENSGQKTADCLGKYLSDDSKIARRKAAWELSRLPADAAAPVLIEHLDTDYLKLREVLGFGLYRATPSDPTDAIEAIDTILDDEADESAARYQIDHHRLRMLRAWLANR